MDAARRCPMQQAVTPNTSSARERGRVPELARSREARRFARRSFLRVSVFAGLTLSGGALISGFLGFFNMRRPSGFGGLIEVSSVAVPTAGQGPVRFPQGKFYLSNLAGGEGDVYKTGASGGLLAIYWKCTHLGCTVPWAADFPGSAVNFPGITGWLRCPCHGSTFSRAGVRVFGPAPRSLDLMELTVRADGSARVDTGRIVTGTIQNPLAAVPYAA
jgi:cytochrome b6-f complex iron-sulfur subunit